MFYFGSMITGYDAELIARNSLLGQGYELIAHNAKSRSYEIDLIISKNKVLYFAEVKYRRNYNHGEGLEYITNKKLKQMGWAAEMWCAENEYYGPFRLLAIQVGGIRGEDLEIIELL